MLSGVGAIEIGFEVRAVAVRAAVSFSYPYSYYCAYLIRLQVYFSRDTSKNDEDN